MASQGQADPVSNYSPNLYTKPFNTSTDPVSDLRRVLEAIEAKRQRFASALKPSRSDSEELLDALLRVVDVRCDARSESPLRDFTTLVEHLRKSPDLLRALSSLAALGPEYDPASNITAWSTLRSYPATVQDHLAWSNLFEHLFPASALEEVPFRARLATLDPDMIIRRFYGGWTTRDPLIRAEEDYELIRKHELNTRHGHFMRSVGGWRVEQQEIYRLNLSPTSIEPSLAEELTEGYEALIVAALGSEGLNNSASGGNKLRWTPNKRLLQDRDRIAAELRSDGPKGATEAANEYDTAGLATTSSSSAILPVSHDVTGHRSIASRSMHGPPESDSPPLPRPTVLPRSFDKRIVGHFTDFQRYFDRNLSRSGDPQDSKVGRKYLEEMVLVLAVRTVPVNSCHEPVAINVLESPPKNAFLGTARFFEETAGSSARAYRRSMEYAFDLKQGATATDSFDLLESDQERLLRLSAAHVGYMDALPVLDTSRVGESLYFLHRLLNQVIPTLLVVSNGVKSTRLVLALEKVQKQMATWSTAQQLAFCTDLDSTTFDASILVAPGGLPGWDTLYFKSFTQLVGTLAIIQLEPNDWRLLLIELHPGIFAYDPILAPARQELFALVRLKQRVIETLAADEQLSSLRSNKDEMLEFRAKVETFCKTQGLSERIAEQRNFVYALETALGSLRGQQQRSDTFQTRYTPERRAQLSEGSSKMMAKQNAAHELTEGALGSEERRAQASRIVSRFEEEEARGLTSSLQSVPHVGPDTSAWFARFVALPPGLDFVRSAQGLQGSIAATAARAADPAKDSAFRAFQSSKATAEYAGRVARSLLPGAAKDAFVDKDGQRERARENFGLGTGAVAARTSWAAANPDRAQQIQRSAQAAKAAQDARDLLERIRRGSFPCRIATTSKQNRLAVGTIRSYRLEFGKPVTMVEFPAGGVATLDFVLDQTDAEHWTATFTVGDSDDDPDPEVFVCDSRRTASFVQQGTPGSRLPHDPELWRPNAQDSEAFLNTLLRLRRDANPLLVPVPASREARQRKTSTPTTAGPGSSHTGTSRSISTSIAISTSSADTASSSSSTGARTLDGYFQRAEATLPSRAATTNTSTHGPSRPILELLSDSDSDELEFRECSPPKPNKRQRQQQ